MNKLNIKKPNAPCLLKAVNLHKSISTPTVKINILNGITLSLHSNESIAIVGESGSGKSTLLALLAGLDTPDQGSINIDTQEITHMSESQRAQIRAHFCGFVFQSFYLMEELTALENVALPMELFAQKNPEKTARHWLHKLNLSQRENHFPKQLSGGEQQRVALCRAFAGNPSILFADEPTANLDQVTAQHVIECLFQSHKESENGMILVTHDHSLASRCDCVYHLNQGKLHAA